MTTLRASHGWFLLILLRRVTQQPRTWRLSQPFDANFILQDRACWATTFRRCAPVQRRANNYRGMG